MIRWLLRVENPGTVALAIVFIPLFLMVIYFLSQDISSTVERLQAVGR